MAPFMDVYKVNIQPNGILDKLKSIIVVKGYLYNKYLIGDTWSPTASMRNFKLFLVNYVKHNTRVHQLDFIGAFLQAKVNNRVFVKLDIGYADYFPEYSSYFGKAFRLLKSLYIMTNSGKIFSDELKYWLINEAGFKISIPDVYVL